MNQYITIQDITIMIKNNVQQSNTNSQKMFGNSKESIMTIEKLLQFKTSDLSIFIYLHHCSEVAIRQY